MKAVLGTEDDVIGLGLTGINQRRILPMQAEPDQITEALNDFHAETNTVYINEALLRTLRNHDEQPNHAYTFIMIPDTEQTPDIDAIEAIAKETLGVTP